MSTTTSALTLDAKPIPVPLPARAPLLGLALGLGLLFDYFFDGKPIGVSAPLFALAALAALVGAGRVLGVRPAGRNLWIVPPYLFFATMLFVRANPLLGVMNALAALALFGLLLYFYAGGAVDRLGLAGYPAVWGLGGLNLAQRPAPLVGATGRAIGSRGRGVELLRILVGALFAFPLLVVFAALMSSADRVFADYAERVLRLKFLANWPTWFGHTLVIFAVAWLAAGGLLWALERRAADAAPDASAPAGWFGLVESSTLLVLIDGLFGLFVWVQLRYLFNPEAVWTLPYEDYRTYAREGFFQLLLISALTMALILGLRRATARAGRRQELAFRLLSTLLVGLSLVILASALQRLVNWEHAEFYVNTQIRIYVRWWTIWSAVAYGWLLLVLWRWPDRFAIGGFLCGLGFLATVDLLNPDADVAAYNLARRDELSVRYVELLSDDSVPVLVAHLPELPETERTRLRNVLGDWLVRNDKDDQDRAWPSFHLARWRALQALHDGL